MFNKIDSSRHSIFYSKQPVTDFSALYQIMYVYKENLIMYVYKENLQGEGSKKIFYIFCMYSWPASEGPAPSIMTKEKLIQVLF